MILNQRKVGIVLTYLSQIIVILTGLIYTPIMLRLLGKSEYGLYQLVFSVVSYLNILSFGFSSSYIRFYSRYKVNKEDKEIAKLNGMFLLIFSIITVICICCGIGMLTNTRLILGDKLSHSEIYTAKILIILMVFNLVMTFISSIFDCYISAHEKFIFQKFVIVLQKIFDPIVSLPLLLLGYGCISVISVTTTLTIIKLILNAYYCFNKLKMEFKFKGINLKLFKEMWSFTFFIFIGMIVNQINWNVDKFMIGRIIGTGAVAVYGVASQINTLYIQLSSTISNIFIPQINKLVAEGNNEQKLNELLNKTGRIQYILLSLILCGFVFFGEKFIELWAGKGYESAYVVALLLITVETIPLIQNIGIEVQRAMNKEKVRSYVYLVIACANIIISIPLIKYWGIIGAAVGTALSLLIGNIIFMNIYYHKVIKLDMIAYWREIIEFSKGLIIPIICGIIIRILISFDNIELYLISIIAYSLVHIVSIYRLSLNSYEKSQVEKIIDVFRRRKYDYN